jgi:hypothetical protein
VPPVLIRSDQWRFRAGVVDQLKSISAKPMVWPPKSAVSVGLSGCSLKDVSGNYSLTYWRRGRVRSRFCAPFIRAICFGAENSSMNSWNDSIR